MRRSNPELWAKIKPLARQMRHEPTPAEKLLWQHVRNRQLVGIKFRRQVNIERFIADFASLRPRLVIEVDGPIHDYTPEEDAIRQAYLESLHYRVLRFTNDQVMGDLTNVLQRIAAELTRPAQGDQPYRWEK